MNSLPLAGCIVARRAVVAAAALSLMLASCVTPQPARKAVQSDALGKVAFIASDSEPRLQFTGFARGKGEGAATGAGGVFVACATAGLVPACATVGPLCGAVAVLWLGVCGVSGAVGGIAGAATSQSAEDVRKRESTITSSLAPTTIQVTLRDQLAEVAARHGVPAATEPDTLIETSLTVIEAKARGINPPLPLEMHARARVLRASDRAELRVVEIIYPGPAYTLGEWAANDGLPLIEALEHGYETLGESLYDELFRLYPFPDREAHLAGAVSVYGLAPEYPKLRSVRLIEGDFLNRAIAWRHVDSLQPTLRWQAFPRPQDVDKAPEEMARVRSVTYDLVIAKEAHFAPAMEVYRRERLPEPHHRLETPLDPRGYYFWAVRAHFEFDGREWVTEWSSQWRDRYSGHLSAASYRFRAPPS